jgi:hypothetical protein
MNPLFGGGKTAVLVSCLFDVGRTRQNELITSGKISTKMEIFKNEGKVLSWLLG